jgi:hypothetical protein
MEYNSPQLGLSSSELQITFEVYLSLRFKFKKGLLWHRRTMKTHVNSLTVTEYNLTLLFHYIGYVAETRRSSPKGNWEFQSDVCQIPSTPAVLAGETNPRVSPQGPKHKTRVSIGKASIDVTGWARRSRYTRVGDKKPLPSAVLVSWTRDCPGA